MARVNAERNRVSIDVRLDDAGHAAGTEVDLAVANIAADVIAALAPRLVARRVITSGYLEPDGSTSPATHTIDAARSSGWAADLYVRQ